jgi:hypothetical protein
MRLLAVRLIAVAFLTGVSSTEQGAQEINPAMSPPPTQWEAQFYGLGHGAPSGWFVSAGIAEGGLLFIDGRAAILEVGQHASRLSVGYVDWYEGLSKQARISLLRTYNQPAWVAPNRTLLGPEVRLSLLAAFGVGLFWDIGPQPQTGGPVTLYTISIIL